jgi:hypothetical protein
MLSNFKCLLKTLRVKEPTTSYPNNIYLDEGLTYFSAFDTTFWCTTRHDSQLFKLTLILFQEVEELSLQMRKHFSRMSQC